MMEHELVSKGHHPHPKHKEMQDKIILKSYKYIAELKTKNGIF